MKPKLRELAWRRSQAITQRAMRAVRPGAYRIVDGVVVEDGGDLLDHRVVQDLPPPLPPRSGTRTKKVADK